jgi:hypothetical protein
LAPLSGRRLTIRKANDEPRHPENAKEAGGHSEVIAICQRSANRKTGGWAGCGNGAFQDVSWNPDADGLHGFVAALGMGPGREKQNRVPPNLRAHDNADGKMLSRENRNL